MQRAAPAGWKSMPSNSMAHLAIPMVAVSLMTEPSHAETIIANGNADFVGLARTLLYYPPWPWYVAAPGRPGACRQPISAMPAGTTGGTVSLLRYGPLDVVRAHRRAGCGHQGVSIRAASEFMRPFLRLA